MHVRDAEYLLAYYLLRCPGFGWVFPDHVITQEYVPACHPAHGDDRQAGGLHAEAGEAKEKEGRCSGSSRM